MSELAIRIYWGPEGGCFQPKPLLSVGKLEEKYEPTAPALANDDKVWMMVNGSRCNTYSGFERVKTDEGKPAIQLLISLFIPTGQRLANGKSPLEMLEDLRKKFGEVFTLDLEATLPHPAIVDAAFRQVAGKFPLEECPFYVFRMEGTSPGAFRVESTSQLSALMRYSNYNPIAHISCLEMSFNCNSTFSLNTKGNSNDAESSDSKKSWLERWVEKRRKKAEKLKAEKLKAGREKAEREKAEKLKVEREKAEREKAEKLKAEKLKVEREKVEKLKVERERVKREKVEKEKAAKNMATSFHDAMQLGVGDFGSRLRKDDVSLREKAMEELEKRRTIGALVYAVETAKLLAALNRIDQSAFLGSPKVCLGKSEWDAARWFVFGCNITNANFDKDRYVFRNMDILIHELANRILDNSDLNFKRHQWLKFIENRIEDKIKDDMQSSVNQTIAPYREGNCFRFKSWDEVMQVYRKAQQAAKAVINNEINNTDEIETMIMTMKRGVRK